MSIAESLAVEPALPPGFEALYIDHHDFVWRCALRLGVPSIDVEDVVQETFIIALRRYDPRGFEDPSAARPSTWLIAILHNVLRNHARSERRRVARLELLADDEPRPRPLQAELSLGLRLLDEFLAELDADRRMVFVLAEIEGMRSAEIAGVLGVNANTVRSRLRAARRAFAQRFDDDGASLVEHAAHVEAPPEASARTLASLALPLASTATATLARLGSLGKGALGLRGLSWVWLGGALGSLLVVGAIVLVAGSSGAPSTGSPRAAQPVAGHAAAARPTEAATDARVAEPTSEPADAHDVITAPITVTLAATPAGERTQAKSRQRSTPPDDDSEAAARERLARARRALQQGDAAAALALVESSAAWPPSLDAHRVALEVGALCRLDRPTQARAQAEAWQRSHPDTNTAISLRGACWDDGNTSAVGGHQAP